MTTEPAARRRSRAFSAGLVALMAFVAAGGLVVFGPAAPASADPVFIVSPTEPTPITSGEWTYQGTATPGDPVRVGVVGSPDQCNTVADAFTGEWTCPVTFAESGINISVQAISDPHSGLGQVEDTREYTVAVEPRIFENTDSAFISNEATDPALSGSADPFATITGAVNGVPCNDVADVNGDYTCVATGANLPADGVYMAGNFVQQRPPGIIFDSDPRSTWYILDTAVTVPDASAPVDTTVIHENVDTTDRTPTISGVGGTAEGQSEVVVFMYRYSTNGTEPAWPALPPPAFGSTYCTTISDPVGEWSCSGAALDPGSVYVFGLSQNDLAGNAMPSPDSEFSIHILPPLPAPTIIEPVVGYESVSDPTVHVRTANDPSGVMFVREGSTNLCPSTPVAVPTFQCDTVPLSNGYHTIRIFQTDVYGTASLVATRTVHIGPYPPKSILKTLQFTFTVIGPDGEVGPDGLQAGDPVTIVASGLPPGTVITAEIHSTPIGLGSATIGPNGQLALGTTIPDVDAGDHEIVVGAVAPGYANSVMRSPVAVRAVKVLGDDTVPVEPEPLLEKQVGAPGHSAAVTGAGGPNAHGFTDPSVFGSSIDSPFDADAHAFAISPAGIVLSGSIAIAFLLLVGFPAELLESTIRSNYDRAFGWLARLRRRVGRMLAPVARVLANPWVGSGLTVLAASIILGFADPDFGFTGASVRLVLAMILAVLAINVGLSLVVMRVAGRSFDVAAMLKPMPAALALVAVSVLLSRMLGISPGFLFGIVLGVAYARELKLRDEARLGVLGVGLTIAAGVLAWLGYGIARGTIAGEGFFNNLLIEALAAITLEALGTLVIALLPIEFLDGRTIFRWSKLAWAGLYLVTGAVFLFIVVPLSDNWGTMSSPMLGWGTVFAVFAGVAIVTWAIFQRRSRSRAATTSSPAAGAPRRRARR